MLENLIQYFIQGLSEGTIYALVALGFTIIYNSTEIINFAQGEFVMLGSVFLFVFLDYLGMPMIISFFLAVIVVALIGAIFERLAINTLKNASTITMIIVTIGVSIFIRGMVMWLFGNSPQKVPAFFNIKPINIFGAVVPFQYLVIMIFGIIFVSLMYIFFHKTIYGKAMRACAMDRKASSLLGINVKFMIFLSFILAAVAGAIAGMAIAPIIYAKFDNGVMIGLKGFCAAVIGKLGNLFGAVIGGLSLGIIENLIIGVAPADFSGYQNGISFFILLSILFIQGLLNKENIKV